MYDGIKWLITQAKKALREDLITVYAAGASFYIVIASLPFAMLLLSMVRLVSANGATEILTALKPFLAPRSLHMVETVVLELFEKASGILPISAITALWTASRGVASISRGVRRVYKIGEPSFLNTVFKDALNTLLLLLMLLLTLVVLVFGSAIAGIITERFVISEMAVGLFAFFRVIVFLLLLSLLFAFIYRLISGKELALKKHFAGALFSAFGWIVFSLGFEFYIENFANYSYIYGSLTAVVLLMLWLYFCMIIFLFGAKINILLNERKEIKQ